MGFFQNLKINKLRKQIDRNPGDFDSYKELIAILMQEKAEAEALAMIDTALKREWQTGQLDWIWAQKMLLQPPSIDLSTMLKETFNFIQRESADPEMRLTLLLKCMDRIRQSDSLDTIPESDIRLLVQSSANLLQKVTNETAVMKASLELSHFYEKLGDNGNAYQVMQKVVSLSEKLKVKQIGKQYHRAGYLAFQVSQPVQVVSSYFEKAIASGDLGDDELVDLLLHSSELKKNQGNTLGAMEDLENAVRFLGSQSSEKAALVRFKLGKLYFELGRVPQALKEKSAALAFKELQNDSRSEVSIWAVEIESSAQNRSAALQHAHEAKSSAISIPLKVKARQVLIDQLNLSGSFEEASTILNELVTDYESALSKMDRFKIAGAFSQAGQAHKSLKILNALKSEPLPEQITQGMILYEESLAYLQQLKIVKAIEKLLQLFDSVPETDPSFETAKDRAIRLKKQLASPDAIREYKLDGTDRKTLAGLVSKLPSEDDFLTRLKKGLAATKASLMGGIEQILSGKTTLDQTVLDDLEELLILSDIGVETTRRIIDGLSDKMKRSELKDISLVREHIRQEIESILNNASGSISPVTEVKPYVMMVVGVNGVGKTTTIAKIAKRFKDQNKSVFLAAGDTFRAGAIEQLQEWGRRLDIEVIAQKEGSDPSAVAWDAIAASKTRNADVVIIDTAGRLHTKSNLMEELKKVHRVIGKNLPGAPHEILLVLDATTGQNAIIQAKLFQEAVNVTGIALTKLDGTAKGGIIIAIVKALNIPVKLIGIGEGLDDLRDFDAPAFAQALFEE